MIQLEDGIEVVNLEGALVCGEPDCDLKAEFRCGFLCCQEWTLICVPHKVAVEEYIAANGDLPAKCSIHKTVHVLRDAIVIAAL